MPTEAELQTLRAEIRAEIEAEMAEQQRTTAELREQVRAEVEAELAERFARRQELREFAEGVCGGETGLSANPDDVVEFLEGLDDEQLERAKAMLQAKVVDFSERGSSRAGKNGKTELPALYTPLLQDWIKSGQSIEEFFNLNRVELGEMDDYDLSQFAGQEG